MKNPKEPQPNTLAACALSLLQTKPEFGFWDFHRLTGAISCREAIRTLRRLGWDITSTREPHTLKTGRTGHHVKYSLKPLTGEITLESGVICV